MTKSGYQVSSVLLSTEVDRLMCYYDKQFVELAYRIVLDREPDPSGVSHFLHKLRDGESRREILFLIVNSDEAKARGVTTDLFRSYMRWRKLQKIPFVGSLLLIFIGLLRIKSVIREFRRVQNAVFGIFQEYK